MSEITGQSLTKNASVYEAPGAVGILFLYRDFEHDVYELIRAFYPGREMISLYGTDFCEDDPVTGSTRENRKQNAAFSLFFSVEKEEGVCRISWRRRKSVFGGPGLEETETSEPYTEYDRDGSRCHTQRDAGQNHDSALETALWEQGVLDIPIGEKTVPANGQNTAELSGKTETEKKVDSAGYSAAQASDALLSFEDVLRRKRKDAREIRKEQKDRIKQGLYGLLRDLTKRDLPWGNLTGIRPAKLAMGCLEQGMDADQVRTELQNRYFVSPGKAALAVEIAGREREILGSFDVHSGYSLYVGIPFCPSICLYCSFSSFPLKQWEKRVEDYLQALFHEMDEISIMMKDTGRRLDTLYIGGGTPTTLSPDQLNALFRHLEKTFGFGTLKEFTVEAGRPDSITQQKLQVIRDFPVTRISVNPQTMNQATLDLIGRRHTVEQTEEAFGMARNAGFDNINMDIIIGLPGEGQEMVENTLDKIMSLDPDSLTVHTLAVKRAARLNMFRDQYRELTFESSQEIMDCTMRAARKMSMSPYYLYRQKNMKGNFENVGYAKVDKAGIYNILIMEEKQPIVALGASGASKLLIESENRIERVENVKDVDSYIRRIDEMILRKKTALPLIALKKCCQQGAVQK